MRYIADLHIHSPFARACSKELTLKNIDIWAQTKGLQIVAAGDFTHPKRFQEIKNDLKPAPEVDGLYIYKNTINKNPVHFLLSTEISSIYSHKGKVRRVHNLIMAPSIEIVEKINQQLTARGCNIKSDGRPIVGLSSHDLLELILEIDPRNVLIPAHAWTPWFAVFGSKSGYNSLEECFDDLTPHIFAIETGLSSDPPMNWQISQLDNIALISGSDAHSLPNLGREAIVFSGNDPSYDNIIKAIKHASPKARQSEQLSAVSCKLKLEVTIEFYPHEGRYHFDGHADCKVVLSPAEASKNKKICPKCARPLTVGVLSRIEELSDRPEGFKPPGAPNFYHLVELDKIIADALNIRTRTSPKVKILFDGLIKKFGNEISILLDVPIHDLRSAEPRLAEGIKRVREEKLKVSPGYDGEYGKIEIFNQKEQENRPQQLSIL